MPAAARRARSTPKTPDTGSPRAWHVVLLVAAAVLVYANSLGNPLLLDDIDTVANNSHIRRAATMFETDKGSPLTGRPVVAVTFAANYALAGTDPAGWRAVNLAVHITCALLLYGVARRALRSGGAALAIALLWAVHPLGSEIVNYITQRTEAMMALFLLVVLYASVRAGATPGQRWSWIAVAACALGMASKEPMAVAPIIVVLFDRAFLYPSFASAARARWRLYAGLAATWILLAIIVATQSRELSGGYASAIVSPWVYLLNQADVVTHYLRLAVWPDALVAFYGWSRPLDLAAVWPKGLFIVALLVAAVWLLVRAPRAGFAAAAFFILLAPSSSVIPIAAEAGADRRMYLPLMALIALAVVSGRWLLRMVPATRQSLVAGVLLAVAAAGLGARTIARNRDYRSELALSYTVRDNWVGRIGHHMVGLSLLKLGRYEEAVAELDQAAAEYPNARYDLGTALYRLGRRDEAIAHLDAFIAAEPRLFASSAARTLIGRVHLENGRADDAIGYLRAAAAGEFPDPEAHGLLAEALSDRGAHDEAVVHYRAYLAAFPTRAAAYTGLGVALAASGRFAEAVEAFARRVAFEPANAQARVNLATALLDAGRPAEARAEAERITSLAPLDPSGYELLGQALAKLGQAGEARAAFARARQLRDSR